MSALCQKRTFTLGNLIEINDDEYPAAVLVCFAPRRSKRLLDRWVLGDFDLWSLH
jgi:hypothetical protein